MRLRVATSSTISERASEQLLRVGARDARKRRPTRRGRANDLQGQRVVVGGERDARRPPAASRCSPGRPRIAAPRRARRAAEPRSRVVGEVRERELEPSDRCARLEHPQRVAPGHSCVGEDLRRRRRRPTPRSSARRAAPATAAGRSSASAIRRWPSARLGGGEIGDERVPEQLVREAVRVDACSVWSTCASTARSMSAAVVPALVSGGLGKQLDGEVVLEQRRVLEHLGGRAAELGRPLPDEVADPRRRRPLARRLVRVARCSAARRATADCPPSAPGSRLTSATRGATRMRSSSSSMSRPSSGGSAMRSTQPRPFERRGQPRELRRRLLERGAEAADDQHALGHRQRRELPDHVQERRARAVEVVDDDDDRRLRRQRRDPAAPRPEHVLVAQEAAASVRPRRAPTRPRAPRAMSEATSGRLPMTVASSSSDSPSVASAMTRAKVWSAGLKTSWT